MRIWVAAESGEVLGSYIPPAAFESAALRAARASVLVPFIKAAATLAEHREAIVNAIVLRLSNARLEAMNSTVRLISHRSRGFRRLESLLAMIRLVCGKVPIALPT